MAEFLFYILAGTLPFHLFAYVPFWNYLRFPKQITAVFLLTIQFLYMGLVFIMVHAGISTSQAQLIAIPIYGGLLFLLVKLDYGKIVFLYILTADYLMAITAAVSFIGSTVGNFELFSWQAGTLILVFFFLTLPFMLWYIRRTAEKVFGIHAPGIWKTIWLLPLFISVMVMLLSYPPDNGDLRTLAARILLMLCMFLIYYHILLIIRLIQMQTAANEQTRNMEQLIQIQAGQYVLIQSRMEETRRAHHDLRQHWAALQGCIESGDANALTDYVKRYGESLPTDSHRVFCKNYAVDALLNFYADKAEKTGISMEISFLMGKETIIPEPEFCVLLGNLLENALDACTTAKTHVPAENRFPEYPTKNVTPTADSSCFIRVNAKQTGTSMFCLAVDNSSPRPPKMDGEQFHSSKHAGFGVGTASVRLIAERYHGDARFEWKDGVFYASAMLNP